MAKRVTNFMGIKKEKVPGVLYIRKRQGQRLVDRRMEFSRKSIVMKEGNRWRRPTRR